MPSFVSVSDPFLSYLPNVSVLPFSDDLKIFMYKLKILADLWKLHFCSISSSSSNRETTSLGFSVSGLKFPPLITNF